MIVTKQAIIFMAYFLETMGLPLPKTECKTASPFGLLILRLVVFS